MKYEEVLKPDASDSVMEVLPSLLSGRTEAIASKSVTHRQFICSALCRGGCTRIRMPETLSRDMQATLDCLQALGADSRYENGAWRLDAIPRPVPEKVHEIHCGESGTTLRLLLPVLGALGIRAHVDGEGRLPERPLAELCGAMAGHGVVFSGSHLPLDCRGRLTPGDYVLPGNVSSQYISGLLLALPLLPGDSILRLSSPLESASYVNLTLAVTARFGIRIETLESGWRIPGCQSYVSPAGGLAGDGDWSNAAAFLAAGALGGPVTVGGLDPASGQGDRGILTVLKRFGASVEVSGDSVTVRGGELHGCDVDLRDIPDLLPVLAVVAAGARGRSRFLNGARLRLKECDRLAGVSRLIRDLGGICREFPDSLEIEGGPLSGGLVQVCNDHRLVMAATLASRLCSGPVRFTGAEAVRKSYPDFFRDFQQTGGHCHVI